MTDKLTSASLFWSSRRKRTSENETANSDQNLEQCNMSSRQRIWRTGRRGQSRETLTISKEHSFNDDSRERISVRTPKRKSPPDIFDVLSPFSSPKRIKREPDKASKGVKKRSPKRVSKVRLNVEKKCDKKGKVRALQPRNFNASDDTSKKEVVTESCAKNCEKENSVVKTVNMRWSSTPLSTSLLNNKKTYSRRNSKRNLFQNESPVPHLPLNSNFNYPKTKNNLFDSSSVQLMDTETIESSNARPVVIPPKNIFDSSKIKSSVHCEEKTATSKKPTCHLMLEMYQTISEKLMNRTLSESNQSLNADQGGITPKSATNLPPHSNFNDSETVNRSSVELMDSKITLSNGKSKVIQRENSVGLTAHNEEENYEIPQSESQLRETLQTMSNYKKKSTAPNADVDRSRKKCCMRTNQQHGRTRAAKKNNEPSLNPKTATGCKPIFHLTLEMFDKISKNNPIDHFGKLSTNRASDVTCAHGRKIHPSGIYQVAHFLNESADLFLDQKVRKEITQRDIPVTVSSESKYGGQILERVIGNPKAISEERVGDSLLERNERHMAADLKYQNSSKFINCPPPPPTEETVSVMEVIEKLRAVTSGAPVTVTPGAVSCSKEQIKMGRSSQSGQLVFDEIISPTVLKDTSMNYASEECLGSNVRCNLSPEERTKAFPFCVPSAHAIDETLNNVEAIIDLINDLKKMPDSNSPDTIFQTFSMEETLENVCAIRDTINALKQLEINEKASSVSSESILRRKHNFHLTLEKYGTLCDELRLGSSNFRLPDRVVRKMVDFSQTATSKQRIENEGDDYVISNTTPATLTTLRPRETQVIEEYSTEALTFEPLKAKSSADITSALDDDGKDVDHIPKRLDSVGMGVIEYIKPKAPKKGGLVERLKRVVDRVDADRRIAAYERKKAGAAPKGCKSFQVLDVWGRSPIRVRALDGAKVVMVIIDDGAAHAADDIKPGCILTIFPPWNTLVADYGHLTTYLMFSSYEVVNRESSDCVTAQNRKSVEMPHQPYIEDNNMFVQTLLNISTNSR